MYPCWGNLREKDMDILLFGIGLIISILLRFFAGMFVIGNTCKPQKDIFLRHFPAKG